MSDAADVERGRGCNAEGRWQEAFEHLGAADRAAYLLGRDEQRPVPWKSASVEDVQSYVDTTLGDAGVNTCYELDAEKAFADRVLGLSAAPATT